MKKKLLTIALGLASTVVIGQIEAGTKILGGEFNYSSSSSEYTSGGTTADGQKMTNFNIIPSFGYMFADNMGAGLRLGINNTIVEDINWNGDKIEDKTNLTVVGLFFRYYMNVAGDNLYFHTDLIADFGYGSNKFKTTDAVTEKTTEIKTDDNTMRIGLRPGWDYFIGDKWAIELNWGFLGYNSSKYTFDNSDENKKTGFDVNFDFTTFGLGARWYF